ncbi:MAG: IS256 family transposase [Saprospiraceae bacterium]|nr:IS256 family transposase [Saprospiraceae bacterium]
MKKKQRPKLEDLIPDETYREQIISGLYSGKRWLGPNGVFTDLLQSFVDAALEGEMEVHLQNETESGRANRRNGHGKKRVQTEGGEITLNPPRDRAGTYEPVIIEKRQKRLKTGLDEVIISLYAKGNSVEDIHRLLYDIYGVSYSTSAISLITDSVWPEILEWQQRPLQSCYPIVYLDGIHYRVKHDGAFEDRCIYTVYGIDCEGKRDILGIYMDASESSNTWGRVLEDLEKRGVEDIFIVCIDGLKGFKQAIEKVYPKAHVQRCIVHKIRNSVKFVPDKELKKICTDLRTIYGAANESQAQQALEAFRIKWGTHGERIAKSWESEWTELMSFMEFGKQIKRMIYTTNPVEAIHRIIRKVTKTKGAWVSEKALMKQLYLALAQNEKSWKKTVFNWGAIQLELIDKFGERYTKWIA